jgi:hypothetical protein
MEHACLLALPNVRGLDSRKCQLRAFDERNGKEWINGWIMYRWIAGGVRGGPVRGPRLMMVHTVFVILFYLYGLTSVNTITAIQRSASGKEKSSSGVEINQ